jgi:hypothetical protein
MRRLFRGGMRALHRGCCAIESRRGLDARRRKLFGKLVGVLGSPLAPHFGLAHLRFPTLHVQMTRNSSIDLFWVCTAHRYELGKEREGIRWPEKLEITWLQSAHKTFASGTSPYQAVQEP